MCCVKVVAPQLRSLRATHSGQISEMLGKRGDGDGREECNEEGKKGEERCEHGYGICGTVVVKRGISDGDRTGR